MNRFQSARARWSISLGTWWGIPLRIHGTWLLVALVAFYLNWLRTDRVTIVDWMSVAFVLILLGSVACHELAHLWAVRRVDGVADEIVLTPLGGVSRFRMATDNGSEILIALAGPIINLVIGWGICLPIIWSAKEPVILLDLLHPLSPDSLATGAVWMIAAKLGLWINHWLVLLNLIPALPFDGGQILKSVMSFPRMRQVVRNPHDFVDRFGQLLSLTLLIVAVCGLFSMQPRSGRLVPSWLALSVLAVVVFTSSRGSFAAHGGGDVNDESEQPFGYDFSQGYTSLDRASGADAAPNSGPISRWIEQRREARQRRQLEIEAEDERRVDEVLARLHEVGIEGLSADERALLQRVSARYRGRNQ